MTPCRHGCRERSHDAELLHEVGAVQDRGHAKPDQGNTAQESSAGDSSTQVLPLFVSSVHLSTPTYAVIDKSMS